MSSFELSQIPSLQNIELTQQINKLLDDDPCIEERFKYLLQEKHFENLDQILNQSSAEGFYSIYLNLTDMKQNCPNLYQKLFDQPKKEFEKWNAAALVVLPIHMKGREYFLETEATLKQFVTVRFVNESTTSVFPHYKQCGKLFQVKGYVSSIGTKKYVEQHKEFICTTCKEVILCHAYYNKYHSFQPPTCCPGCYGNLIVRPDVPFKKYVRYLQEMIISGESDNSRKQKLLKVTVEDDLVDTVELGDGIYVVGTLENRQKFLYEGQETNTEMVLKANSVTQIEKKICVLTPEDKFVVEDDWCNLLEEKGEFGARDHLLASFDPALYAMTIPKFLVLISLASCVENEPKRPHSHVLFVGAPGISKSHLLQRASKLSPKSLFAACSRASTAGLTVGVEFVEGEQVCQIGALPKCDGGVCCLDEFNQMSLTDMGAMHEAMEQQTISIAKAGVVATLSSRCVIIGACNPKNLKQFKKNNLEDKINFGISEALLSRFDIIFILRNFKNDDFHLAIARRLVQILDFENDDICTTERLMTTESLKKHLLAARDIKPKIRSGAENILKCYYGCVYRDKFIDPSRSTLRCLHALFRLSKAYARLLLKPEVTELDAVVIICLIMENSYSMGLFADKYCNLVETQLPIGPTEKECVTLLKSIGLEEIIPKVLEQLSAAQLPGRPIFDPTEMSYMDEEPTKPQEPSKWDALVKKLQQKSSNLPVAIQETSSLSNFFSEVHQNAVHSTQNAQEILNKPDSDIDSITQVSDSLPFTSKDASSHRNASNNPTPTLEHTVDNNTDSEIENAKNDETDHEVLEKDFRSDCLTNNSSSEILNNEAEIETPSKTSSTKISAIDFVNQFSISQYSKNEAQPDEEPQLKRLKHTKSGSISEIIKSNKKLANLAVHVPTDTMSVDQCDNILQNIPMVLDCSPNNSKNIVQTENSTENVLQQVEKEVEKENDSQGFREKIDSISLRLEGLIDESFFEEE